MTDNKVLPEDDIGPFYKTLGAVCLLGGLALVILEAHHRQAVTTLSLARFGILCLVCLALIRPKFFDSIVKTLADKIPAFSFSKTKSNGQDD